MPNREPMTSLRAFVSCSFADTDQSEVVQPILALMRSVGIDPIMLRDEPGPGEITKAVEGAIIACPLFIAIATQDHDGAVGKTREWVIAEMAQAHAYGKEIVLLRESGVTALLPHGSGLRSVEFPRGAPFAAAAEMVAHLRKAMERYDQNQIGDELRVKTLEHTIAVRQLRPSASPTMNGATFYRGIELLHDQVTTSHYEIRPDLFVGVNHAGTMIAAYLEGRICKKNSQPFGVIKTGVSRQGQAGRNIVFESLPPVRSFPKGGSILIADGQVKQGYSGQRIIQKLKADYASKKPRVYYAVLVACGIDLPRERHRTEIIPMAGLFESPLNTMPKRAKFKHPPDFLAFVSLQPVKPPDALP